MMSAIMALVFLYNLVIYPRLAEKYHWKTERDAATTQPADVATPPVTSATGPAANSTTGPSTTSVVEVKGAAAPLEVVLGSTELEKDPDHPKSPFPIGVTITNRGAAIESVTLNRFRDQYDQPTPYVFQKPYDVNSPLATPLATRSVSINGGAPQSLDKLWNLAAPTSGPSTAPAAGRRSASFYLEIPDASGKPALRITKTYEIRDQNDKTAGYEMLVTHTLANLTGQPLKARLTFNGTTSPKSENSRDIQEVIAGFNGGRENVDLAHGPISNVMKDEPLDVKNLKALELLWSGISSAYFDAIIRNVDLAGGRVPIASVKAFLLNPDERDSQKHAVALDYETADLDVPVGGAYSAPLSVYLGPKLRAVVKNDYYAVFPLSYDETLVLTGATAIHSSHGGILSVIGTFFSSICGFCSWPWLINLLVSLLQGLHFLLHDWGLAIIALVCIVRLILHPITKRSQISMSRMTKMGPEMERLKAKHKDDPDAFKKAQMEFYKEQGVAPFLGCLPMFLQMPIWIALWSSLQSTFEIRHAPFLMFFNVHLTWIKDLSQPDRLIPFRTPLSFFQFHIDAINILPVLMAVVFYIQQKFQPQPVATTPEQAQQQKMMKWMSIFLFPLFLYGQPSGLNLYIFTSTLIGIIESKRIRDHIKEREEKEKAGVVIIDAPEPGKGGGPAGGGVRRAKNAPPEKSAGGIAGFMAKLQELAEQAKQEQEKKAKKGKR